MINYYKPTLINSVRLINATLALIIIILYNLEIRNMIQFGLFYTSN